MHVVRGAGANCTIFTGRDKWRARPLIFLREGSAAMVTQIIYQQMGFRCHGKEPAMIKKRGNERWKLWILANRRAPGRRLFCLLDPTSHHGDQHATTKKHVLSSSTLERMLTIFGKSGRERRTDILNHHRLHPFTSMRVIGNDCGKF